MKTGDTMTKGTTAKSTTSWRELVKVHPAAEVFPMLPDKELRELGEDIKEHGLKQGVVVWSAPEYGAPRYLIDGRNRLAAMEVVGMATEATVRSARLVTGTTADLATLIISANIKRRHLTPRQRADLAIKAMDASRTFEPETAAPAAVSKGGRGRKGEAAKVAEVADVSKDTAQRAINNARGKTSTKPSGKKSSAPSTPSATAKPAATKPASTRPTGSKTASARQTSPERTDPGWLRQFEQNVNAFEARLKAMQEPELNEQALARLDRFVERDAEILEEIGRVLDLHQSER